MYYGDDLTFSDGVALRKESVDRNEKVLTSMYMYGSRSPQGERG